TGLVKVTQFVHDILDLVQGIPVVLGLVIRYPTDLTVGGGPTQGLIVDVLADGRLDQITPGQEDAARLVHDQGLVAHDGQVGSTGHTATHHGRDLGNPHPAHHGIVPKDAPKVLLIREDAFL